MKTRQLSLALLLIMIFCGQALAGGRQIMARMQARLPEITRLKTAGIIGETKNGYLFKLKKAAADNKVVKAENMDRRLVYTAIARQQGVTPELVGRRRALQIKQLARAGTWLQAQNGKWYQKK